MRIRNLRWITLATVFIVVSVGLVLNTNLGTLSSFGWQAIATICPVGVLESALASKTIFPRALIVLVLGIAFIIVAGKVFCAWVCPVAPIRSFTEAIGRRLRPGAKPKAALGGTPGTAPEDAVDESADDELGGALSLRTSGACSASAGCSASKSCSACTGKRKKLDSRHVILGASLVSAAIFGFPVFCLICPIGLLFGTAIVVWQFIGFEDVSLSLLIYPLVLIIELVVLRKWCATFCPLGAFLSLLSLPNRFLKPVVDRQKCTRTNGGSCSICADACGEGLDPHFSCSMNECTKCGICKEKCPTGAISFALMPKKDAYESTNGAD